MLERLLIKNIALISSLDIELDAGFNVLTGETGAGKSIIVDSVNLVLGERANRELIAVNQQKARVEAFFSIGGNRSVNKLLEESGLNTEDDELILMREITTSGKSICRVNGEIVTLATLHMIADSLVDIHGQHAHQSLLDSKKHMSMIDEFNSKDIEPVRKRVGEIYREYKEVEQKLNSGFISEAERERRIDILSYQINEIEAAHISVEEEKEIAEELSLLTNAERISTALESGNELLSGESSVLDGVRRAADALARISSLSKQYEDIYSRIDGLYYELEDAAYQLRDLSLGFEYSPERLNELETRLDYINSLKRKYGGDVQAVLDYMYKCQNELDDLNSTDEIRVKLNARLKKLDEEYRESAALLTKLRIESADRLAKSVTEQLHELGMSKARFIARNTEMSDKIHINGNDNFEFMLSANAGEPCKPLIKVASGGELSRVMLAIKTVCADADEIPTLVFDEVDTGISGVTAVKVGEKMTRIANSHQVLCITHLPQIAAFADTHLLVQKNTVDGETHSTLHKLTSDERKMELARIMGSASADESAVKYAEQLMNSSNAFKASTNNQSNARA